MGNPVLLELLNLKGIGKELFAELGGAENFIRAERKAFADGIAKRERLLKSRSRTPAIYAIKGEDLLRFVNSCDPRDQTS